MLATLYEGHPVEQSKMIEHSAKATNVSFFFPLSQWRMDVIFTADDSHLSGEPRVEVSALVGHHRDP